MDGKDKKGTVRRTYTQAVKALSSKGTQNRANMDPAVRANKKGTLRTAFYTLAVMLICLWIIFLIFEVTWIIVWNYGKATSSGELAALVGLV